MIKIRRKKIFEDDAQQPVQNNNQQVNNQQPAQNTNQNNSQQPQSNNQQPAQQDTNQNQQQTTDQNQQQNIDQNQQQNAQQSQQPQQNPNAEKVKNLVSQLANNAWLGVANSIPELIQKEIPDFKEGNQAAEPAIKAWGTFKSNPSEENYKAFISAFETYGGVNPDDQNNQQQVQQNVNAGAKAAYSFNKKLMENLAIANKKKYYNSIAENYFDKSKFKIKTY